MWSNVGDTVARLSILLLIKLAWSVLLSEVCAQGYSEYSRCLRSCDLEVGRVTSCAGGSGYEYLAGGVRTM